MEGDRQINVHAQEESAFRWTCENGHLEVVNRLIELNEHQYIDVHLVLLVY